MKFKFEGTHVDYSPWAREEKEGGKVTVEQVAHSLESVLEAFQAFLAGCGYSVKYGEIQFVPEDDEENRLVEWANDSVEEHEAAADAELFWKDVPEDERSWQAPDATPPGSKL